MHVVIILLHTKCEMPYQRGRHEYQSAAHARALMSLLNVSADLFSAFGSLGYIDRTAA